MGCNITCTDQTKWSCLKEQVHHLGPEPMPKSNRQDRRFRTIAPSELIRSQSSVSRVHMTLRGEIDDWSAMITLHRGVIEAF